MVTASISAEEVWGWLNDIADPEIPVLSIVDLGIVRDVRWRDEELVVTVTPTYCGCPAMDVIVNDIRESLRRHGIDRVKIETRLSPAWTTDWLTEEAKSRLRNYSIAPPQRLVSVAIPCPHCGSANTELVSRFGSTPCKALCKCRACLEPFDAFKKH
ncbi:MAG TPA: 1,2-phenylacetyl-CoA epoxidase subunit PaaD [Bryobacteraceae bacterium]|nr:1,2-phenylacetyl-CoA epoxidase subunit PaaD [Bryobacteraceae bacterium]